MKILFVHSRLSLGGAEKMAYEVIKGLDRSRFQVKVCCLYSPGTIGKRVLSEGIDMVHSLMQDKYDLAGIYRLFSLLKKERPDILHLESSPLVLFWGFICARLLKIPRKVTVIHTMRKPEKWERFKSGIINRLLLRRLDSIGVVSRLKMESLIRDYGIDPDRLCLLHNAVDTKMFSSKLNTDDLRKSMGFSETHKVVGMVGRLVVEKAYDVFLKSAQGIASLMPDTRFLIIGNGGERKRLEDIAGDLGLKGHVLFLGERQDIPELISLFDVAVLSSRIESFPVALLEYMAGARGIVATNVGDNSKVIKNNESGIIVPPEDPEAISKAVIDLLRDNDKAKQLGMNAKKIVEDKFSLNAMLKKMEKFLQKQDSVTVDKHIVMVGPHLKARGGVSSFANNYLCSRFPKELKVIYHATTVDGKAFIKICFFIKSLVRFIARLLIDKKIRIIHILIASNGSFYRKAMLCIVSRFFKKAVIFHIHGAGFDVFYSESHPLRRFCIRKVLDLCDSIIVLSKTWYTRVSAMTKNKNIKIIPNPIDTTPFSRVNGKGKHSKNILTVGRLGKRKGTYDILDIAPVIIKEIPGARFYLAGDGDLEKVERICRERGIDKNVVLLGWLDKKRLVHELENAALFLLPSYNEGLPVAILEAMASGLPVISTRVGGIPEVIEDGVNGLLVEPGQKEALTKAIIRLFKDTELKNTISKNNIEKIDSDFSLNRVMGSFFEEYKYLSQRSPLTRDMKQFIWYIRRLSCMSVQEVVHRIYKLIRLNIHIFLSRRVDLDRVLADAGDKTSFYFDANGTLEIRREFLKLFPNRIEDVVEDANRLCSHNFRIFDSEWNLGEEIDWHRNRHNLKDARFIWELNRHQHLVTLGKAYLLTGQKRYAIETRDQILSWISQNPAYKGVNWKSSLEVSLRLISWCWTYKLIKSSGVFSISSNRRFLEYIYRHAEFTRNNLSRYSSGNNHSIGEAAGLLIAGLTFPGFKAAGEWLDTGKKVLFKEILDQVHPDGVTKEQAFGYQGFVMELALLAIVLLQKNDIEMPKESLSRFYSMAEFIKNIMDTNGNVPHIGDSDNGAAIRLSSARDYSMYRSLLSSASILSDRGDFKEKGAGFKEEHYWLFGIDGLKRYRQIKKVKTLLGSRLFDKGGYAVFRNPSPNGNVLIMDCGELGYGAIAAHGHADLFSITLSSNGTPLLIDPGTYLYHSGNSWRDYFRGTSAHNTIAINDKNQSEITGPFMWGRRVMPRIQKWETKKDKDYIRASYANCDITHTREILFDKKRGLWRVTDFLDLEGENKIRQYFHLSAGSGVKDIGGNIIESKNKNVYLYIFTDASFSTDIRDDWSSSVFGSKVKSPTLVNSAAVNKKSEFVTFLYISNKKMRLDQLEAIRNEA